MSERTIYDGDLIETLQNKLLELDASVDRLAKTGEDLARKEAEYKIALRAEVLKLRDEGQAVGVINMIVYGDRKIAGLRYKRDLAETIHNANQEHINATKLEIKIIESMIDREWNR